MLYNKRGVVNLPDMGMTDNQWKDNLRSQYENWDDVEELVVAGENEKALKLIRRNKERIAKGLESN